MIMDTSIKVHPPPPKKIFFFLPPTLLHQNGDLFHAAVLEKTGHDLDLLARGLVRMVEPDQVFRVVRHGAPVTGGVS